MAMTREQAIESLHQCQQCKRWITVPTCDHCLVDGHRCPPTPAQAIDTLRRAAQIGREAEEMMKTLRGTLG